MADTNRANILLEAILLKLCEIELILERDKKCQPGVLTIIKERDGVHSVAEEIQESGSSDLKD